MDSEFCGERKYARNSFTGSCKDCAHCSSESRNMIADLLVLTGLY
jgi:predicted metal-binding protein